MVKRELKLSMIRNHEPPYNYDVLSIGNMIDLSQLDGQHGHVIATFNRVFYFEVNDQTICITNKGIGRGPLVINSKAPETNNWIASGVKVGDRIIFWGATLYHSSFRFNFCNAFLWVPSPLELPGLPLIIEKNLSYVGSVQETSGFKNLTYIHALDPIEKLRIWLKRSFLILNGCISNPPKEVKILVGLGPGLTPSGDDFLGGVLLVLRLIDKTGMASKLWDFIFETVSDSTNRISAAHLFAASQGSATESVHQFLNSLFEVKADKIISLKDVVSKIGHTSGSDIMLGCQMALEVWIETEKQSFKVV